MTTRFIDLSHRIEAGMITYKGLPAPLVCDYLARADAAKHYADGATFSIQRLDMVGNTGTYLDSPFHRYEEGADLAALKLEGLAHLPALVIDRPFSAGLATEAQHLAGHVVGGMAVLIRTQWDQHWRTDAYFDDHPFLTEDAATWLAANGARLVGIDSHNIDDTRGTARPVHSILLGAGIPICEHMTNLGALPETGASFYAVPPKLVEVGTFAVRAFAEVSDA